MKTKTQGIFKQNEDKTWRIDTKIKINGKWVHLTKTGYKTLGDAKSDYANVEERMRNKYTLEHEIITFDDVIREYKKMRANVVNESTLAGDNSIYNIYFFPHWKGKKIEAVFKQNEIKKWYSWLTSTNRFSKNKQNKVITRINDLLEFAYKHKFISANIKQECDMEIYQVKGARNSSKKKEIWSLSQEREFLKATELDGKDHIMFKLFLAISPRISEFLALQVASYDRAKRKITIEHQMKNIAGKGYFVSDDLKSHDSYRSIIIPSNLANDLNDYIDTLGLRDKDFLWYLDKRNIPMSKQTFRRKLYYYCDVADVPKITPHTTRHMNAVKLASASDGNLQMLEIAAQMLGHTPSVFMDTYANHNNEDKQEKLLEKIYIS